MRQYYILIKSFRIIRKQSDLSFNCDIMKLQIKVQVENIRCLTKYNFKKRKMIRKFTISKNPPLSGLYIDKNVIIAVIRDITVTYFLILFLFL